jgi:hypothetical protein
MEQDIKEQLRIVFVQNIYLNIQTLIGLIDQKSNFILAIVSIMSAALFAIVNDYFISNVVTLKLGVFIIIIWYLAHLALVIRHCIQTVKVRGSIIGNQSSAPGLIFPFMVRAKYKYSDALYFNAIKGLEVADILADYSQQIAEVSYIYEEKTAHIAIATQQLAWLLFTWALIIATVLYDEYTRTSLALTHLWVLLIFILFAWILFSKRKRTTEPNSIESSTKKKSS